VGGAREIQQACERSLGRARAKLSAAVLRAKAVA
jgi:hypothetical protein